MTSRAMVSPSSNTEWIMFALAGLDDAALLGHVDQLAQLDLGGERAVAEAAAGRDRVAEQDQQRGHRAEHPAERAGPRRRVASAVP